MKEHPINDSSARGFDGEKYRSNFDAIFRKDKQTDAPWREFDPKIELPRFLDQFKRHRTDKDWREIGKNMTFDEVFAPHFPKIWRTRRPEF